jgi:peptidoglycan/LPS O-acetylase OafA/YrhL
MERYGNQGNAAAMQSFLVRMFANPNALMPLGRLTPDERHMPSLNGLRAASIALVLAGHYISQWVPGAPSISGQLGVTVFFVISGFLITRLLIAEFERRGSIGVGRFYARRAVRLFPVLFAFVVVIAGSGFLLDESALPASICAALYVTNYCDSFSPQIFEGYGAYLLGTWSLSVEEQFYLLAAPAVAFFLRQSKQTLYLALAVALVAPLLVRLLYSGLGYDVRMIMFNTETRLDSLAFGMLLSVASAHRAGRRVLGKMIGTNGLLLSAALLGATLLAKATHSLEWPPTHSLLGATLALLVLNVLFNPQLNLFASILNWPVSDWVGRLSYSLYLWHFCAMMIVDQSTLTGWFKVIVATIIAFTLSILSYYTIERYFLKFRQKLHS